ncbi:MAG: MaoC family dehydratase N-terminal domain-containing protein [Candidatus Binatia bacterium]
MPDDSTLDYIPEYLSDDVKRLLRGWARESAAAPAPLVVNEYLIRHWCETLEDGNPLYLDDRYATAQGLRSVVAPVGSIMTTFAMPFRWPWPPGDREPVRHIHYYIKDLLNLPVGIITAIDVENHTPLLIGDRVSVSQRLVSISPWKKTRLGEGHFWTMDRLYRNQRGDLVVRERMTAFGYGREDGGTKQDDARPGGGWSPAVEEMIQGDKTGYKPPVFRDRFWEDVREGEKLPELRMPITVTRCIYLASATRDFSPQHSNRDYAQQRSRTKDIFVNTPFNMGMISRFMTDWGGPRSTVRRMNLAMRGNICAGDDMIISGKVTKKHVEGGEHRVDLDIVIATQDGPVTPCSASLALPSRDSGNKNV